LDLENIILIKIRRIQKRKYHIISLICGFQKHHGHRGRQQKICNENGSSMENNELKYIGHIKKK
jgi:hypothetical protein